jgi:L-rhamnose mutarotase
MLLASARSLDMRHGSSTVCPAKLCIAAVVGFGQPADQEMTAMRCDGRILMGVVLAWACLMVVGCTEKAGQVRRFGMVVGLQASGVEEYKRLHADVWPGVLKMIAECNIRNYSIYLVEIRKGEYYLFSYFEYTGNDFDKDMEKMKADPTTQQWWQHTAPLQVKLPSAGDGELWQRIEEVFHAD